MPTAWDHTAVSVRKSIKMADKFVKKCFLLQKINGDRRSMQAKCSQSVHRVAQALIYTAGVHRYEPLQAASLSARPKGRFIMFNEALYNGSRDLFYSFAIITFCFPQVMAYLWVSVSKSTSSAFAAQWPHCRRSVTCTVTRISCWKGVGQGDSSW